MGDTVVVIVAVVAGLIFLRRRRSPAPARPPKRPTLRLQSRVASALLCVGGVLYLAVKLFS